MQVSDLMVLELQGFHDAYGNGPDFWDAYQRIMTLAAQAGGDLITLANEMASLAQGLGATKHAQLL
ncbi:arginine/ornithine N-succinyltransferase beta subunit [Xanthomonas campestris]|nr:arginine/ornithine N-succinyltransferase beta subunit [Xanthomonas sp. CFBP 8151]